MDFYKRMQYVCDRIPRGRAATYGQIALLCGKPKNSRQVGYALRNGLAGKQVPAHRIVNANGILIGAAAFEFPDMQRLLLQEEGVLATKTDAGWKVDLKQYGWKNTLAEAEELLRIFEENHI
ncbi:MAG: MGMT family protein [Eubacteriales bacterium]|nr:MGMT family protein [Eubacteriales bacterium]